MSSWELSTPAVEGGPQGTIVYTSQDSSLKKVSEVAVGGVLVLLIVIIVMMFMRRIRGRWLVANRQNQATTFILQAGQEPGNVVLVRVGEQSGLDPQRIRELGPTLEYSAEIGLEVKGGKSCPVCLGDYKDKDMLRKLEKCEHYFHQECIDEWLQKSATCPICRVSYLPEGPNSAPASAAPAGPSSGEGHTHGGSHAVNIPPGHAHVEGAEAVRTPTYVAG